MSLLAVEDLAVAIGGRRALRGVSFEAAAGETLGVIGESGSGKSMTALAIMGLLPEGARASGAIRLEGTDLMALDERALCAVRGAEIGIVFQEPMTALNPVRTIGDQVAETVLAHRSAGRAEAARIAADALARVGLPPGRTPPSRYPHQLSGGQRQRVAIAMAIALRPKLLIADEPTTALDVTTQARILRLLASLARDDGMGLILITHDLAVAAETADRIVVMKDGAVVEHGPAARLLAEPRAPYTRRLREASTHVPARAAPPPAADATPALEARGVVRAYPGRRTGLFGRAAPHRAVDGVSFTVGRGETVGLVGESGCGKSTLARAALGLEPLDGGAILLHGEPLDARRGVPNRLRRRAQSVFQDPYGSFDPRWRVERLVSEPFHLLDAPPRGRERRERVAAALEQVGLSADDLDRYPHEFSGGQRQRLAIARALAIEPELIVLDEATSALDVSIRAQILDLLADLSSRLGLAYLFIAHDLTMVRAVTDRTLVMAEGRIVEEGPTEALFAAPAHPATRALLDAAPDLDAALARRRAAAPIAPAKETAMRPGPRNLITDVAGLRVGSAHDDALRSGATALTADAPFVAAVRVMGGAPGARETDLLAPEALVDRVDALVLSGGSAFGLDAASGATDGLRAAGRGFETAAGPRVPIVPAAILFDLANGGAHDWTENPYRALGRAAFEAAAPDFALGSVGAGRGANCGGLRGGLGSASLVLPSGATVGALVAVNALGRAHVEEGPHFWAAPFEIGAEFGGLGPAPAAPSVESLFRTKANPLRAGEATTIAVVATDAALDKPGALRVATAAHDGLARALMPAHTPFDGDLVFAAATGARPLADPARDLFEIGHAAALCLARATARAVFEAAPAEPGGPPAWRDLFG